MDPPEVERRLKLGEDSRTEFKSVAARGFTADAGSLAKAIAALANSGGGEVFIGVDRDGSPSGVGSAEQADALMRQVSQICADGVHPAIACSIRKVETGGKVLLVVEAPAFTPNRPYRAGHVYYIRDANRSREATREELVRLLQSADYHFDEQPVGGAQRADLDDAAVVEYLDSVYPGRAGPGEVDRYLQELGCVGPSGAPTVAGILLFGRDPTRRLRDARITAVRFAGTSIGGEFADRQEIEGRLPRQIDGALAFLDRHLASPARIEGAVRREMGLPEGVLREAVVNAVAHRDYRPAAQIRLFVFDDRVEVHNPGELLNRLTIESIRLGMTQRRNPAIASLLGRAARRESVGWGIPEMIRLMRDRSLPEPEFEAKAGNFKVVLRMRP
ncbi:MAG: ATP-binding protein [Myxococcota bacterium]|nr:ATP-binding protein [Myxococcota bacterium]